MQRLIFGLGMVAALLPPSAVFAQDASTAMAGASHEGKYVFVLFHKEDDEATRATRQTLQTALAKRSAQAASVSVRVGDPAAKALVERYGVARSPMPLVLAVAPNGAVTGGFAVKLTEQDVAKAFVSPGQAAAMKGVQVRKLVLVCALPAGAATVPEGVRDFKADARYGAATEVVNVRLDDAAEAGFLKALQIDSGAKTPVTALLVPPGRLLGTFPATATKQQMVERVTSLQGCCPGGKCCPGGCCGKP